MRDFTPVAPINYSDLVLVVNPAVPAKTLQELIALAKSEPGKLNYASSGPGTPYHMAGELFKSMAGLDIVHVPYKESSGARTGVLGGQVEMMFDAVTVMNEHVKAGKVRALATSGKVRSGVMPDVPTLSEAGVPGYEAVIWLGLIAPKNTPPAIVNRLNAEVTKIVVASGHAGRMGEAGRDGDDDDARRVRQIPRRRHRQVGAHREALRRARGPVSGRMPSLRVLSAGAAKGIVQALAGAFETESGTRVDATFDSAGAIRNAFVENGARCDVVILPAGMLDALAAQAPARCAVDRSPRSRAHGHRRPAGEPLPEVGRCWTRCGRASSDAPALYCPDTERSTAGIHFAEVLRTLGIDDTSRKVRSLSERRARDGGAGGGWS